MSPRRFDDYGAAAFESGGEGPTARELDGLRVVFDQKVGLHAADLQKRRAPAIRKPRPGALTWRAARERSFAHGS